MDLWYSFKSLKIKERKGFKIVTHNLTHKCPTKMEVDGNDETH